MMTFGITADEVRNVIGQTSSELSDATVNAFVTEAEYETEQLLKTKFTPTTIMERVVLENSEPPILMLKNTPVITVKTIYICGTAYKVDPSDTYLNNYSGKLQLRSTATSREFSGNIDDQNTVEYQYAKQDETTTSTTTTANVGSSSSVAFSVSSVSGFEVGDYVKLEGIEGNTETVVLTGTSASLSKLTAQVRWPHDTGTRVVKMGVPNIPKELCKILAAIRCVYNRIGKTYGFATSYSVPELSVTKTGPLAHYGQLLQNLIERRDWLLQRYRPEFTIA
jgi:hypothetical protein